MTRILILGAAMLVAALLFITQNRRLHDLQAETASLKQRQAALESAEPGAPGETDVGVAGASPEKAKEVQEAIVEAALAFRAQRAAPDPERAKRLMLGMKDLSAANINDLVEALRSDPRLADFEGREELVSGVLDLAGQVAPEAMLGHLETHRHLPNWEQLFDSCNRRLLASSPKQAIERHEEETAKGNPDYTTSNQRQSLMFALAATDPDRMLAMAMSPELAGDPHALAHLGGFVDDHLEKPSDHLRFMAALRRAAEKRPDSDLLTTIRKDYVREMSNALPLWPIEQVRTLVDGEFTPEEKLLVAGQASHRGDLDDREKWADWFLGIEPEAWDRWIATQPQQFKHPVVSAASTWGREDPEAGGKWLETMPKGELRSQAMLEFAWAVADRNPELASSYLDELPDSRERRNLIQKIGKTRR